MSGMHAVLICVNFSHIVLTSVSGLQCQSLFSFHNVQCGKKVVHNSLELVDFAAVLYKEVNLKNQIKEALLHAVRD